MTLDATFWPAFEAAVGRLNAAVHDLGFLHKKAGRRILNTFEVSVRVGPGLMPERHIDVPSLETLSTGLNAHATLQRERWRVAVLDACEDVAAHLRTLHAALVTHPVFARVQVLGVDLSPRKVAPFLWMSDTGHVATSLRPGHTILNGDAARSIGQAMAISVDPHHPVWLVSRGSRGTMGIHEEHGFGAGCVVLHQKAATLTDALFLLCTRFPHMADELQPCSVQAAQLVPQHEVDLAVGALATT